MRPVAFRSITTKSTWCGGCQTWVDDQGTITIPHVCPNRCTGTAYIQIDHLCQGCIARIRAGEQSWCLTCADCGA